MRIGKGWKMFLSISKCVHGFAVCQELDKLHFMKVEFQVTSMLQESFVIHLCPSIFLVNIVHHGAEQETYLIALLGLCASSNSRQMVYIFWNSDLRNAAVLRNSSSGSTFASSRNISHKSNCPCRMKWIASARRIKCSFPANACGLDITERSCLNLYTKN